MHRCLPAGLPAGFGLGRISGFRAANIGVDHFGLAAAEIEALAGALKRDLARGFHRKTERGAAQRQVSLVVRP